MVENDKVTILWEFSISTGITIQANRPGVITENNEENTCHLIDMNVPGDQYMSLSLKSRQSSIERVRMCHIKTSIVPVIGAHGLVNKNASYLVENLPSKPILQSRP